jgi:hypothetical protein
MRVHAREFFAPFSPSHKSPVFICVFLRPSGEIRLTISIDFYSLAAIPEVPEHNSVPAEVDRIQCSTGEPVFKRFFRILRFRRADRIARELVVPLHRGFAPFKDEDGEVIADIRNDDFVLTYIFGAVLGCIESAGKKADTEFTGMVLRQTLERLFGQGQERAELCAELARRGEDFSYGVAIGYADVREFKKSRTPYPTGLIEHLRMYGA